MVRTREFRARARATARWDNHSRSNHHSKAMTSHRTPYGVLRLVVALLLGNSADVRYLEALQTTDFEGTVNCHSSEQNGKTTADANQQAGRKQGS
ncbi:hypothetical protein Q31a_57230 [Aureliella helgolandensis]|uniref:Uncharacterized protein n=1 Tax=Aureliella helgolandensis TaxID=2527968 RepID=A0A518GFG2_9BACT|nr:hypothetical protein Q31a_57230 [Aureliella helgolandensis]